jgi:hypothetical protein
MGKAQTRSRAVPSSFHPTAYEETAESKLIDNPTRADDPRDLSLFDQTTAFPVAVVVTYVTRLNFCIYLKQVNYWEEFEAMIKGKISLNNMVKISHLKESTSQDQRLVIELH